MGNMFSYLLCAGKGSKMLLSGTVRIFVDLLELGGKEMFVCA